MIAPIDEQPRSPRKVTQATVGPMACCLASVLLSLQTSNESFPPLFANMDKNEYWRRVKPFLGPKAAAAASRWETSHGFLPDATSSMRYRRHQEALVQILRDADLIVEAKSLSGTGLSGYRYKDKVKAFELLSPTIQEHLIGRITPNERFLGMKDEQQDAEPDGVTPTRGMCIASLLEQGYVRGKESLDASLARFARTRGFAVAVTYKPVSQVPASELPCLLVGPNKQATVLLALSEDGPGWGLVCVPETVQPLRKTPAGWVPFTAPAPSATLPATASVDDRIKAMLMNAVLLRDPAGQTPQSLDYGAHIVAIGCLDGSWKAVPLTEWKALDNWQLGETE